MSPRSLFYATCLPGRCPNTIETHARQGEQQSGLEESVIQGLRPAKHHEKPRWGHAGSQFVLTPSVSTRADS